MITILRSQGFTEAQRESILARNSGLRKLFLTLDTKYLVQKTNVKTEVRIYNSQSNAAFRVWRENKKFGAEILDRPYQTNLLRVDGRIYGSLMSSIQQKISSNWVASRFIDAYIFDTNLKTLERGAKFWLTVEKKYDQGHFIKYGEVTHTSLEVDGELIEKKFIRYSNGGIFATNRFTKSERLFYSPVNYLRVASLFQPHRRHPITKRLQPHMGIDFELAAGESVYAARTGRVVRLGNNRAAGNFIVLSHGNGIETSYNHLQRLAPQIRVNTLVAVGQKIAEVGCTGYCTRAHLHFAIKKKGRMVDPLNYIRPFTSGMENFLITRAN